QPGRVIALDLSHMGLQERLSPHLENLSLLASLDLCSNSFYGMILIEIGHLCCLKELMFELNQFEGNIPPILTQCQNLEVMSLATNRLIGGIPREFGAFPKLQQLSLSSNDLRGQIPSSLGNISTLQVIRLVNATLTGSIPSALFNRSLTWVNLMDNYLSGSLPFDLCYRWSNIQMLALNKNQFSGLPPETLTQCKELIILGLSYNRFQGSIPRDIGSLQKLQKLYISTNNLTNMIPRTISNMSSLHTLGIAANHIEGEIPSEIGNLVNLQLMGLADNLLTGGVPQEIFNISIYQNFSSSLQILIAPNCQIRRRVPEEMQHPIIDRRLERLQRLYLDNDHVEGPIPDEISNLIGLGEKVPRQNRISGSILNCIQNFSSLHIAIPSSTQEFESLASLNLLRNSFQGSMPQSIGHLKGLEFLDLSYNELSNTILESLEGLAYLQILNLSINKLSGEIPNCGPFGNFLVLSFIGNEALSGNAIFQVPRCKENGMKSSRDKRLHILYIVVPILSAILLVLVICLLRKSESTSKKASISMENLPIIDHPISYRELSLATNNFRESNLLKAGSFTSVYKGRIDISVKVLNLHIEGALRCFDAECDTFLVKVTSTCTNANLRALALQYVPCGSLEKWLYSNNYNLDLHQRVKIMVDAATAIEYLHHDQSEPIVHCDLKPSNILLNEGLVVQVCDFGIAKILVENKLETQTQTLDTIGYIAPEYGPEGKVSYKGNLYGFNILLLEVITGKKPTGEMFNADLSLRQWVGATIPERVLDIMDSKILCTKYEDPTLSKFNSIVFLILKLWLECSKDLLEEIMDMKIVVVKLNKIELSLP
ncbi:hypothetical protein EUGRSUZ_C01503, partial [Eucalyptus grandis]